MQLLFASAFCRPRRGRHHNLNIASTTPSMERVSLRFTHVALVLFAEPTADWRQQA